MTGCSRAALPWELRLGHVARTTKDIDVDWSLGESDVTEVLLDAADTDLGDFFDFRIERAQTGPDPEGQGQRWRLTAMLAGREFDTVLVDVGLEKVPIIEPVQLELSTMLEFAGVGSATIPSLSLEQHLAEKVHAYTRTYGADAKASSRVKDLIDVALIAGSLPVEAQQLQTALAEIFRQRATHQLPGSLPPPPAGWAQPWRKLTRDLPVSPNLVEGHQAAAALVDPVLTGKTSSGGWSPDLAAWGDSRQ